MVLAVIVNCVPHILRESTVLAFLVLWMQFWTLASHFIDKLVESFMLSISNHSFVFIHAVGAFLVGTMVAFDFSRAHWGCLTDTIWAFWARGVIAATLWLFLGFTIFAIFVLWLDGAWHAMDALLGCNVVASLGLTWGDVYYGFLWSRYSPLTGSINHACRCWSCLGRSCCICCHRWHLYTLVANVQYVAIF